MCAAANDRIGCITGLMAPHTSLAWCGVLPLHDGIYDFRCKEQEA
jgi:hypothetical protein